MIATKAQKNISKLIEQKLADLDIPLYPSSLYDPVRYMLSLGGKRIRFYFTLIGCGLFSDDIEEALPAATAIELLHNFTLLHDDIMDRAVTRRGKPSVFKKWDTPTAILSGDAMYAWAFEQLQYYGRNDHYSKEQYCSIIDVFLQSARTVCEGQAYDLTYEQDITIALEDYLHMIEGKTAALISTAFRMGGVIAGADYEEQQKLEQLGNNVGVAFQIQDDILDVVADPAKFGKTLGGDIAEGKKTYLYVLALQRGNYEQRRFLQQIFSEQEVSEQEISRVIELYKELGVISAAQKTVHKHYNNAITKVYTLGDSPYQQNLIEFLTNLKNRDY